MGYTNSPLIHYTKISPSKTSPRNHRIDTITIHCMAGNLSVEACGRLFASGSRKASSNYGIGSDGRIAMYVEEKDRSWCSSNSANDHRAITIEVANDGGAPDWHVSDNALNALIDLLTDICKRNQIRELKWKADKAFIGQVEKQNMTVHRWFKNKACPGDYLYGKHAYIASEVNRKLGKTASADSPAVNEPHPSAASKKLYRVRTSWANASSQIGAYSSLANAINACKNGYFVFDDQGAVIYPQNNSVDHTGIQTPSLVAVGLRHAENFTGVDDSFNISRAKGRVLQHAMNLDYGKTVDEDGIIGTKSKKKLETHYVKAGEKQYMVTAAEILMYLNHTDPLGVELPGIYGNGLTKAAQKRFGGNGRKITASDFLLLIR